MAKKVLHKYGHAMANNTDGHEVRVLHIRQISLIYSFDNEVVTLIAVWNNYQNPDRLNEVISSRE